MYIAAAALVCLCVVLAVPVEFAFRARLKETFDYSASFGWLFGLVSFPAPSGPEEEETPPQIVKKKKKKKGGGGGRKALAIARNAAFRRKALQFIKRILGAIKIYDLSLHARLGLDDPADTGMFWGYIGPLSLFIPDSESVSLRLEPEFARETLEFDFGGRIRVIPLQMAAIVVLFLLSPVTLRTLWEIR